MIDVWWHREVQAHENKSRGKTCMCSRIDPSGKMHGEASSTVCRTDVSTPGRYMVVIHPSIHGAER